MPDVSPKRHQLPALSSVLHSGGGLLRRIPLTAATLAAVVMAIPLALIVCDRASNVATLWFCFTAFGGSVALGVLLSGSAIGVAIGLLSAVPGGWGVQDTSMAGTYVLLGVALGPAVVAIVLFRFVYYLAPFALSLRSYYRLTRRPSP